jgi:hypothetical protein
VKLSHVSNYYLNDELIGRTRHVWQPRLFRDLGGEDARQIVENVTGFVSVPAEWSRAEVRSSTSTADLDRPENGGARHGR